MASLLPPAWMENTQKNKTDRYALIEMGALSRSGRSVLIDSTTSAYWPLMNDDSQPHLTREGPWLFQPDPANLAAWQAIDTLPCALHAWIESPLDGATLAEQLAPAMIAESPKRQTWLLRFYTPMAIQALHAHVQSDWHAELFSGIERWGYRNDVDDWQFLAGLPPNGKPPGAWRLSVDDALWKTLAGDPEVMALTAQLANEMSDVFTGLCAGERPRQVAQALAAADSARLTSQEDRRVYVYLWLTQGEGVLQKASMTQAIARVAQGESSLTEQLQSMEEV